MADKDPIQQEGWCTYKI